MKTCCFIGHRKINLTDELRSRLYKTVEDLIVNEGFDTFLLGSKSCFNSLSYETVSDLKKKYPHIRRIYVRAEYPHISEESKLMLLKYYEDTFYHESLLGAGRAVYVKRNFYMIDLSEVCVVYYDETYSPFARRSGTQIAFEYAVKQKKRIINLFKIQV